MLRKLVLGLVVFSSQAFAGDVEVGSSGAHRVVLEGPMSGTSLAPIVDYFTGLLADDVARRQSKYIDMVIDSPGGSVVAGFELLALMNSLQEKGYVIRCYVKHVAASMAFQTLVQCDERHALTRSFLLWHRARVFMGGMFGSAVTAPMATTLGKQLQLIDDDIIYDLMHKLGADPEYVMEHLESETLHTGLGLHSALPGFITAHRVIPGMAEAIRSKGVIRSAKPGFFDALPGQIIYIWKEYPIYLRGTSPAIPSN